MRSGGEESERVYHAFVLGLLVSLQETYLVRTNRESGYGRYDVMLIPRQPAETPLSGGEQLAHGGQARLWAGGYGKGEKTRRGETLEAAVEAGRKQLTEKRYETELEELGVQEIVKLVIVFAGKEVRVEQVN
ncbi:MAG: AAA-ATPase-like protein [Paenibacillaceae bacterium]|nr:AAA-ATPase-like protein [Paenibacillaceae bacterium]